MGRFINVKTLLYVFLIVIIGYVLHADSIKTAVNKMVD